MKHKPRAKPKINFKSLTLGSLLLALMLVGLLTIRFNEAVPGPVWVQPTPQPASRTGCFACDPLEASLRRFEQDSILAPYIGPVLKRLPAYRKFIKTVFEKSAGQEIAVLLQNHEVMLQPDPPKEVLQSQKKIMAYLSKYSADVVGWEGVDCPNISEDALLDLVVKFAKDNRMPYNREGMREAIRNEQDRDAMCWFTSKQRDAFSLGFEDDPLHMLHGLTLELGYPYPQDSLFFKMTVELRILRSEVALAKVLHKLQQLGKQRGVIVMGFMHGMEYSMLFSDLGLKSAIYDLR